MKAPVNIHPPKNWQDFETLCLKLWGEIWKTPHEIEFNSSNSQGQNGVDIYAPVDDGTAYNGIQCKNKKFHLIDGMRNRITISTVKEEIEKAKTFKPALKKLIIATSLQKDGEVEEYVRETSLSHAQQGLFTIQICFWDYIERVLPEYENIHNWYLKNEDFYRTKELTITFKDGNTEAICHPKFQKTIDRYHLPRIQQSNNFDTTNGLAQILALHDSSLYQLKRQKLMFTHLIEWEQLCWFRLSIVNTGQAVIEDFKIELDFEGEIIKVGVERGDALFNPGFRNNVHAYNNTEMALYIKPEQKTLVQNDSIISGNFYIEPKIATETEVNIKWKILARDYTDSGILYIKVIPKYYKVINRHETTDATKVRDDISFSLIKRPASYSFNGGYQDKESDYSFE
ncbi:hypothetical protein [Chitinophaga arvensicola]|uniref:Uncharacterized protein n=1 Tax=Chitinophaga arvensicola TaxID=29529 RepID=A0A1I0SE17_9BACT|nr:hypothetical protein [Chitinophaga arvensicola]SEW57447.1 hypothetical protein SAMN04488122_6788 [Chitinophaga arvensicola]